MKLTKLVAILMAAILLIGLAPASFAEEADLSQYNQVVIDGKTLYEDADGMLYTLKKDGTLARYKPKSPAPARAPGSAKASVPAKAVDTDKILPIAELGADAVAPAASSSAPRNNTARRAKNNAVEAATNTDGDASMPAPENQSRSARLNLAKTGGEAAPVTEQARQEPQDTPDESSPWSGAPAAAQSYAARHGAREEKSGQNAVSLALRLSASAVSGLVGETVILSVSAPVPNGFPTGSLTFFDNGEPFSSGVSLSGGAAVAHWSPAYAGTHALTAQYQPGQNDGYLAASASMVFQANAPSPATQASVENGGERPAKSVSSQPEQDLLDALLEAVDVRMQARKAAETQPLQKEVSTAAADEQTDSSGLVWYDMAPAASTAGTLEKDESAEPETSAEPEVPAEPETNTAPEAPTEPETNTAPEAPTEPETSTEPETPAEPETSTEPETPAEPETSTEPETPA
ncbi:MAG: Ig-like domain repeat protein, partial [Firmicutes bacterium]|nr:Ig-like domain repeat protein [Bacillota bacterium]